MVSFLCLWQIAALVAYKFNLVRRLILHADAHRLNIFLIPVPIRGAVVIRLVHLELGSWQSSDLLERGLTITVRASYLWQ